MLFDFCRLKLTLRKSKLWRKTKKERYYKHFLKWIRTVLWNTVGDPDNNLSYYRIVNTTNRTNVVLKKIAGSTWWQSMDSWPVGWKYSCGKGHCNEHRRCRIILQPPNPGEVYQNKLRRSDCEPPIDGSNGGSRSGNLKDAEGSSVLWFTGLTFIQ